MKKSTFFQNKNFKFRTVKAHKKKRGFQVQDFLQKFGKFSHIFLSKQKNFLDKSKNTRLDDDDTEKKKSKKIK
jgi:hypothetical protein